MVQSVHLRSIPPAIPGPGAALSPYLRLGPPALGPGPGLLGAWLSGRTWLGSWTRAWVVVGKSTDNKSQKGGGTRCQQEMEPDPEAWDR
jgi:hypothetical protein